MPVTEESLEQLRARILVLLVPAVCHKLNNGLGVVSGLAELIARRPGGEHLRENAQLVFEQSTEVAGQVLRLGSFAHVSPLEAEICDAGLAFDDAAALVAPVFQVAAVPFESRRPGGSFPALVDRRRLFQTLVILACSPLASADAPVLDRERRPARLRLSMAPRGTGCVVRVSCRAGREGAGILDGDPIAPFAAELGARLRTRRFAGCTAVRLELAGIDEPGPP
jgi:hypothetical protein